MAATGTPTPNIGLRRPQGTDPASVDDINYNSNLIDTKLGAVGNTSVQEQINSLNSNKTNQLLRVIRSYNNVTIPSSHYVEFDSYEGMGVNSSYRCISMTLRGWAEITKPFMLAKGQNGDKFYIIGEEQTIGKFDVEYYFYLV